MKPPSIAVLGGGSGLATLLRGLKRRSGKLTAVVTMTDEGGSSGRLRRAFSVPPPGDLRHCLVSLARDGHLLSDLFEYRFPRVRGDHGSFAGHAFGNLFLTALASVAGGFDRAVATAGEVLAIQGKVLPATLEPVRLTARLANGRRLIGEERIGKSRVRIRSVALRPRTPSAAPGVLEAIRRADVIVLGPGSLYTSVIPPLLVDGVADALIRSRAFKVYACNLMTQPGETEGYSAADHLSAVLEHVEPWSKGRPWLDVMLVNAAPFTQALLRRYAKAGAFPVPAPAERVWSGVRIVSAPLRPVEGELPVDGDFERVPRARHSPERLASAVFALARRVPHGTRRAA